MISLAYKLIIRGEISMKTNDKNIQTLLSTENQQEAEQVMEFLAELEPEEKKDFLLFVQGVRFAKGLTQIA